MEQPKSMSTQPRSETCWATLYLAGEDGAAHDALGQLSRPGAGGVVDGGAVAVGAGRVVQGRGAVGAAASAAVMCQIVCVRHVEV